MSAIFISHSSKDNVFCQKLINWLDELGHRSVFLDFDENSGIAGGQDWEQKLYKELRVCSAMIVVCTEDLMNSKWCFAEITHARSLGKQIFPIQIAPCDINSILSNTQVIDFINLEEKVAFERLKQGLVKAGIDAKDPYAWDGSRPPYPGLLAFQEEDAAIFFGREKEIREGLDVLTSTHRYGGSGLIMVLGASGSGKSSLVRAGIIPRLKRDPERWLVLNPIQPGEDPFRELAKALKKAFQNFAKEEYSIDELYGQLQSDLQLAKDSSKKIESKTQFKNYNVFDKLHEAADLANASILFTIDQFEELLDRPDEHLGSQFLYFLKSMLHKKESKLIVLGTMRSDFLGMFQQNPALLGLEFGKILVGPVNTESLTEIIEKPAELAGVRIEPKLVQGLIEDTRTDDALPLMAFTLRELYDNYSEDNLLEFREYEDLGGIHGSVAKSAEAVLSNPKLSTSQEELLRKAFLQMTRVNDQGNFTRNRVAWSDINPGIHQVLNRLVNGRLLVSSADGDGNRTLEVAHESLFRSWKRLKEWLDEDREFLLWRKRLRNSLEVYEHNNHDKSTLLGGIVLQVALNWVERNKEELNQKEKFFIEDSLKEDKNRKLQYQREKAISKANYLISEANRHVKTESSLALRLAGEALKLQPKDVNIVKDTYLIFNENYFYKSIFKHSNEINSAIFSPDGKMVLTASRDNSAQIWDLKGNPISKSMEHFGNVITAVFSPDGNKVLTASADNTAQIWDLKGNPILKPFKHSGYVNSAVFSPDGNMVLTASDDKKVCLWDLESDTPSKTIKHSNALYSSIFSPDGKSILAITKDHSLRIWDLDGKLISNEMEHTDSINSAVFSPDGKMILTSSKDRTARLWDLNGNLVGNVMEHADSINSAVFSPDGKMILTSSNDKTFRLWDFVGNSIRNITEEYIIDSAIFSPDGSRIIIVSYDSIYLWDLEGRKLGMVLKHSGFIISVLFSPDGKVALTSSIDRSARLWDIEFIPKVNSIEQYSPINSAFFSEELNMVLTISNDFSVGISDLEGNRLGKPMMHSDIINLAVFSPDGKSILTTSNNRTAQLWDLKGNKIGKAMEHFSEVESAVFSPDGKMVLTTFFDYHVNLWDMEGNFLGKALEHSSFIDSAVFSPDGTMILTSSYDNTVNLWNPVGKIAKPMKHSESVKSAIFSSDGKIILTICRDHSVRFWNLEGNPLGKTLKHSDTIISAIFSPNMQFVLTASFDNTARLWDIEGNSIGKVMEHPTILKSASFSSDGKMIITVSYDSVFLWDIEGMPIAKAIKHPSLVLSAFLDKSEKKILTISEDGILRKWDILFLENFLESESIAPFTQVQKEKYEINE